jgi:hypothetical protein
MSRPRDALDLLRKGGLGLGPEWEQAHALCQMDEGDRDHDLVHALCHWIEGDIPNRNYWYARLTPWTRAATVEDEWHAVAATLT